METEETVKEGLVTASKAKSIWLAFVDIVLFAVLSMIFLFLFAIPFALVFPELKTEVGETNIYFQMLNEVLPFSTFPFSSYRSVYCTSSFLHPANTNNSIQVHNIICFFISNLFISFYFLICPIQMNPILFRSFITPATKASVNIATSCF